jgi:hypothetical protein
MSVIDDVPDEILEEIFARMTLKSLICTRCVCHRLRDVSLLSSVDSTRSALYELYLTATLSPAMQAAKDYIEARLIRFDRETYLASLYAQHPYVPEEFQMWLLEWPAGVAIGFVWPGLPKGSFEDYGDKHLRSWNYLSVHPPQLYAIEFYTEPEDPYIAAMLPIQTENSSTFATYLVLDDRPSLDCLLVLSGMGDDSVFPLSKQFDDEASLSDQESWSDQASLDEEDVVAQASNTSVDQAIRQEGLRDPSVALNGSKMPTAVNGHPEHEVTSAKPSNEMRDLEVKNSIANLSSGQYHTQRGELVSAKTLDGFVTKGWINWLYTRLSIMDKAQKLKSSPPVRVSPKVTPDFDTSSDSESESSETEQDSSTASSDESDPFVRPPSALMDGDMTHLRKWDDYLTSRYDE